MAARPCCSSTRSTASPRPSRTPCWGRWRTASVLLVAATTENPSFSVVSPLLSRSLVLRLESLTDDDVRALLRRAAADERGLAGAFTVAPDAEDALVRLAAGDARRALTALEAAADGVAGTGDRHDRPGRRRAGRHRGERALRPPGRPALRRHQRVHQVHPWLGRGCGAALPRPHARGGRGPAVHRAAADGARERGRRAGRPTALQAATAAAQVVQLVGLPECRLALAQATLHLAAAPKSNAVVTAIDAAMSDVRDGAVGAVPAHLRDGHYAGAQRLGNAVGYRYPPDDPDGVVAQQYPPDDLVGRDYYAPTTRGAERALADRLARLRRVIRGS